MGKSEQNHADLEMQDSNEKILPPPAPPWNSDDADDLNDINSNVDLIPENQRRLSPDTLTPSPSATTTTYQRWNFVKGLLLCQVTSMLICGTAVFSTLLVEANVDIPTLQSFGNYSCLALVYTLSFIYKTPKDTLKTIVKERWWKYLLIAIFDVEGNYLMVKAYRYTSITSVQLLDSVTIPVVLILSWLLLKYRYKWIHFIGVGIAMAGMALMIYADVRGQEKGGGGGGKNDSLDGSVVKRFLFENVSTTYDPPIETTASPNVTVNYSWLGDLLAVLGATCYGFSNVGQEYFVSDAVGTVGTGGQHEFLAAIGFFGALVNGVQFAALEWREARIVAASASSRVFLCIAGFNACLFAMYSIVPHTLKLTSAAVFNISILTSDFYTFLFGLFLFKLGIDPFYFLAYLLVIIGIVVYSWRVVPHR